MAIKKSQLYATLWKSCDELRGGMDASQYKDYVLVLLFVKYVSDKAASQQNYVLDVPAGGSFDDMVALKGDKEIGDKMNKIVARLAEANDLKGVIDVADWNEPDKLGKGREMVDRLSNLVAMFDDPALDFRANRVEGDDLLGDAYEYLMRNFATQSGKSKGQFYTPAEVSRIMAKVIGAGSAADRSQTIYDPTCGSGSLLLKAHDEAKGATGLDLALYGQEMDNATSALARMNMILHDCPTAEISQDNTLSSPHFRDPVTGRLKTFDFVVANPPFSTKAWSNGFDPGHDEFGRFPFGVPPRKNGDYAFLLHVLASLKSKGKGAIILPHGVLFRGGAEGTIRREILRRGYLKGIIGLPPNMFYGTGIPACILVLDKQNAAARKGVFMIDASRGFLKDGNKNRLREQDVHRIVDTFTRLAEVPGYSRMVSVAEIGDERNEFNLNLPRYIDSSEPEDIQDLEAHLRGGIPNRDLDALERYWKVFPGVRNALFGPADRPGYSQLKVAAADVKATIFDHPEFASFRNSITAHFDRWRAETEPILRAIAIGDRPKALIERISESLLAEFESAPLIDAYDVYQHLMDYWTAQMQDDVSFLVQEGWTALVDGEPNFDLIPSDLIVSRYFEDEQVALEALQFERDEASRAIAEFEEEHGGEDGLLAEARNSRGVITMASMEARLSQIADSDDDANERAALEAYSELVLLNAVAHTKASTAQKLLRKRTLATYDQLAVDEVQLLVVNDKWTNELATAVRGDLDRVSIALSGRLRELIDRYGLPLLALDDELTALEVSVGAHLEAMGVDRK